MHFLHTFRPQGLSQLLSSMLCCLLMCFASSWSRLPCLSDTGFAALLVVFWICAGMWLTWRKSNLSKSLWHELKSCLNMEGWWWQRRHSRDGGSRDWGRLKKCNELESNGVVEKLPQSPGQNTRPNPFSNIRSCDLFAASCEVSWLQCDCGAMLSQYTSASDSTSLQPQHSQGSNSGQLKDLRKQLMKLLLLSLRVQQQLQHWVRSQE